MNRELSDLIDIELLEVSDSVLEDNGSDRVSELTEVNGVSELEDLIDFEVNGVSELEDLIDFEVVSEPTEINGVSELEDLVDFEVVNELEDLVDFEVVNELEDLIDFEIEELEIVSTDSETATVVNYIIYDIFIKFYKYIKNTMKGVGLCYACIILVMILFNGSGNKQTYKRGTSEAWVSAFTSGDFETCDSMAYMESDRILGYDISLIGSYEKSVDMYKALLKQASACISEVLVLSDNTMEMHIKQVKSTDEVQVDEKALNNLIERYKESLLSKEDFKQGLVSLYYDAFERTVITDFNGSEVVVPLPLKEKGGYITSTNTFIRLLLDESGLQQNMELYEEDVQSTFNYYVQKGKTTDEDLSG